MPELRHKLENDCGIGSWDDVSPHLKRDAVIRADNTLDIIDVALAVAEDNANQIAAWIEAQSLTKPSIDEFNDWQKTNPDFKVVIVQPFVIVQLIAT